MKSALLQTSDLPRVNSTSRPVTAGRGSNPAVTLNCIRSKKKNGWKSVDYSARLQSSDFYMCTDSQEDPYESAIHES